MGKFWKEIVGGQVQQGVYQAGPRHASKQYGSFKTGRPPRLPFQFVTFFELNDTKDFHHGNDQYHYSSLVRAIDMPTVKFTVEKRNQYNKLKPKQNDNHKRTTKKYYTLLQRQPSRIPKSHDNIHKLERKNKHDTLAPTAPILINPPPKNTLKYPLETKLQT